MPFKPGDKVRYPTGKTGTVLSEPRQYDRARGDPFTGLGVEVRLDSIYGSSIVVDPTRVLTHLDGPGVVVMVERDDEEVLEEIVRSDSLRGSESVESAARRLQKQIIYVVERAAGLDPAFREFGSRVTFGQAAAVLEAHREPILMRREFIEQLRDMEVNLLVEPQF